MSLANVHCNMSTAWFEVSDFCDIINTEPSLGLWLVILLFPCVMEILKLWISRTGRFLHPNQPYSNKDTPTPTGPYLLIVPLPGPSIYKLSQHANKAQVHTYAYIIICIYLQSQSSRYSKIGCLYLIIRNTRFSFKIQIAGSYILLLFQLPFLTGYPSHNYTHINSQS